MTSIGPKPLELRLDPVAYENLRQQVLRHDGWRRQSCGTMSSLEVHHKKLRSHSGDDSEQNLITLCTGLPFNRSSPAKVGVWRPMSASPHFS